MNVLEEILSWSVSRPSWQRDALRRLVINGDLDDEDIDELAELLKGAYGLVEIADPIPLEASHIPERIEAGQPVSLTSIFHHKGVNALAQDQTLKFGPGLTLVYGDNAAGKTGYIRILKSACRARGQEPILGNVTSGTSPHSPVVSIKYKIGENSEDNEWSGDGEDEYISRVSVFDTQSASVYLTEKTDVAFRPFGLDLFDKLVRICHAVRGKLEVEQRALSQDGLVELKSKVPPNTETFKLLSNVTSLTRPDSVNRLANYLHCWRPIFPIGFFAEVVFVFA